MEALRGEDSVTFGDDNIEENYQSASDNLSEATAGVGSVVDSIKNTVKSAVGLLSEVSLGLEGEQCLDKEATSLDDIEDGNKGQLRAQADNSLGKEIQPEGSTLIFSKNMAEEQGTSGSGASEDWSVVDPIPQPQSVVSKHSREDEKQEIGQADTASCDSSLTSEIEAREPEAEESTSGSPPSKVGGEPEIEELAADSHPSKFPSAAFSKELEIQEVLDSEMCSHEASSPKSSTDWVPSGYNDKPASLRRRNRSFKVSETGSNCMESGVAGCYSTVIPAPHVSPRFHERDSAWALKDRPKEHSDEWDNRSASRVGITEPTAADSRQGKVELPGAQSDAAAFGSSLGRSETVHLEPSEQKRKSVYPSGYDSDTDDDDDDEADRLERRPAHRGTKKEEEAAGSSNIPDGEGFTSGRIPRREVYTIPASDVDLDEVGSSTQFLSWPTELLVQAVGFQVNLIIQVVAISLWMFNVGCSLVTRPIHQTILVKDRATNMATGAVNQGFGLISQVREGVAQTGPLVTKLSKKTAMGCLGSAYVILVLGLLLIPAFFADLFLVSRIVEEPVQIREILNFDYTQARPSATVPILSGQDLEKAKTLPLDKLISFRKIPTGHNFHINVILTMPESDYNIRLGMFQVTAEMISARNQVLMRQSKPCMLRFRSTPVRLFKTMLYSIPLLMGFTAEAQKLEITVLQAQEKLVPTASVRILLEPKAGYLQGGGLPELYEGELHLESALPWPKAIIRRWKWTFYVWNGVCLFLFEVAMILCCCRQVLLPGLGGGPSDMESIMTGEVKKSSNEEDATKKSKNKRRVYFEDDTPGGPGTESGEVTSLTGDKSEEGDHLTNNSDDSDIEAGWSIPPLEEVISTVEEGGRAVEEAVKTLGESLVGGVSKGPGHAFTDGPDEK